MRYLFLFLCILAIAIVGGASLSAVSEPYAYGEVFPVTSETMTDVQLEPLPLSILFAGDVMLARRTETLMDRYGADYPYKRLPYLRELADTVIVNFEAAVPEKHVHTPDLTFRFSVDAAYLDALRAAGVTHANLANNHSYDMGEAGFLHTEASLSDASVLPFGGVDVSTSSVRIITHGATSAAIVGLSFVDAEPDFALLQSQLASLPLTDVQVAYVHWGTEYQKVHSAAQEQSATKLASLGFDAIVGHHPHVVQDIGTVSGVPVFYSLGNFIFDQYFDTAVQEGLLVQLSLATSTLQFTLLPHTSLDSRTQPRLLEGEEKEVFLLGLAERSTSTLQAMISSGVITVPLQ